MAKRMWYLTACLGLLLAACSSPAGPSRNAATAAPARPSPSATPEAEATQTASASQSVEPSPSLTREPTGALTHIGTIEVGPLAAFGWHVGSGLIGFDAGYVAWATRGADAEREIVTWFSPDGATWTSTVHSVLVAPCPDWFLRPNLDGLYSAASNGRSLILVASVLDSPTRTTCDEQQLVALQTENGTTWARSEPFGVGWAESTWTTPEGFETRSNEGTIWRSADGIAWAPVFADAHGADPTFRVGGASSDGRRLAVGRQVEGGTTLFVSRDADPWTEQMALPPGGGATIVLPEAHGRPWVVAVNPYLDQDVAATVHTSIDLTTWSSSSFPRTGMLPLVATDDGWIAMGFNLAATTMVGCQVCPSPGYAIYWSGDAQHWSELAATDVTPLGRSQWATGPAGIIAIAPADQGRWQVWQLALD